MKKILLVEDEESVRELAELFLQFVVPEVRVEAVETAEEALALLCRRNHGFGAVLTDNNLGPGMSGMQLAENVAAMPSADRPTVFVMSGRLLEEDNAKKPPFIERIFPKPIQDWKKVGEVIGSFLE